MPGLHAEEMPFVENSVSFSGPGRWRKKRGYARPKTGRMGFYRKKVIFATVKISDL